VPVTSPQPTHAATNDTAPSPAGSEIGPTGLAAAGLAADWGHRTLRQLVLLLATLAVLNVAIILGIYSLAMRNEDEQARRHSIDLVSAGFAAARRDLGRTVVDYSWFDDAVDRLVSTPDPAWAGSYLGSSMARTFGIDRVLVIDGSDAPIFAVVDGSLIETARMDLPRPAVLDLARRARAAAGNEPVPVTDLVMVGDMLHIVAASTLLYEKPEAAAAQTSRAVMIIAVPVKSEFLERLSSDLLLMNLVCVTPQTVTPEPSLFLIAENGDTLAKLARSLSARGSALLVRIIPALAAALGISFIVIGVIYLRLQRVADERQRQAIAIASQSALLRVTLDTVHEAICVFGPDLKMLAFNRRYVEIYDLPPDLARPGVALEIIVRYLAERGEYGPGDPVQLANDILRRVDDPKVRSFDRTRQNGTTLEARRMPMPSGGFVMTISDVTERLRAESELRHARDQAELASRAKSVFLANIGHELRTPLNAILGFSEIIQKQSLGPVGVRRYAEYAADINDSGLYLLEIINDILDISKIEAGRMQLHEQQVDLARTINMVVRLCVERATSGGVTITTDVPEGLSPLYADERAVKQILVNLLSNAIKFTPAGGSVTVMAWIETSGQLALSVADTGIGIAEKDMPIVLAPFGQVDSALSRRYPGTGLGLPLVKSLVELHGGELTLRSTVGKGTTATVRFPAGRVLRSS